MEILKLTSESHKFAAEKRKLNREHGLAPWVLTVAVIGGLLGIASFLGRALHLLP